MDLNAFTTLIGSLGFPIVMCLLLYYRMDKQDENHKTEMEKITEALNNNTQALTAIATKISTISGGDTRVED